MNTIVRLSALICLGAVAAAAATAATLRVPPGCTAAANAEPGASDYATRIVHDRTSVELVLVPAGSFTMGSTATGSPSLPPHPVTIATPFYMGRAEITNAQYRRFTDATGYDGEKDTDPAYRLFLRHWHGLSLMPSDDDSPVVWVSWKNARAFCEWAGLALPSEAQWEYACRAGTTTLYHFGSAITEMPSYSWHLVNSAATTHPVAQLEPNQWGLHDMLGNVWEWMEDDYVYRYDDAPVDGTARLQEAETKALRGSSWSNSATAYPAGCAARYNSAPGNAANDIGFRVTLPLPPE